MVHSSYQKRFANWIRWRLPEREADIVLAGCAKILAQFEGQEYSDLVEHFGPPSQAAQRAAQQLTDLHSYRRWLTAFACMTFCLLFPLWLLLFWQFSRDPTVLLVVLLFLGILLSWMQFRPKTEKNPVPQGLRPVLAGMVVALAVVVWVLISPLTGLWNSTIAQAILYLAGILGASAGLFGLINARLSDRRWSALYLLGLTVVLECTMILDFLVRADMVSLVLWIPHLLQFGILGLVGLAAAGLALYSKRA